MDAIDLDVCFFVDAPGRMAERVLGSTSWCIVEMRGQERHYLNK